LFALLDDKREKEMSGLLAKNDFKKVLGKPLEEQDTIYGCVALFNVLLSILLKKECKKWIINC
jgi:hypothetical protein